MGGQGSPGWGTQRARSGCDAGLAGSFRNARPLFGNAPPLQSSGPAGCGRASELDWPRAWRELPGPAPPSLLADPMGTYSTCGASGPSSGRQRGRSAHLSGQPRGSGSCLCRSPRATCRVTACQRLLQGWPWPWRRRGRGRCCVWRELSVETQKGGESGPLLPTPRTPTRLTAPPEFRSN